MGCFLLITQRDFDQLESAMKQHLSILTPDMTGGVRIEVHSSRYQSAKEMARIIRAKIPDAQSISVSEKDQQRALPTPDRYEYMSKMLQDRVHPGPLRLYRALVSSTLDEVMGAMNYQKGDVHEWVAGKILIESQQMRIVQWPDEKVGRQGVDLLAMRRGGSYVAVEVKTGDNINALLEDGVYKERSIDGRGYRQCSDDWLREVGVDPDRVDVMAVCINPDKRTVSIFRRLDSGATRWKPIMSDRLSNFYENE